MRSLWILSPLLISTILFGCAGGEITISPSDPSFRSNFKIMNSSQPTVIRGKVVKIKSLGSDPCPDGQICLHGYYKIDISDITRILGDEINKDISALIGCDCSFDKNERLFIVQQSINENWILLSWSNVDEEICVNEEYRPNASYNLQRVGFERREDQWCYTLGKIDNG